MACNILIYGLGGGSWEVNPDSINQIFKGLKINSNAHVQNTLILHEGTSFNSCIFNIDDGSQVEIGKSKYAINNLTIHANGGVINIGNDFSCWGVNLRAQERGSEITIGNDCMFSSDILVYASDIHAIINLKTNELINRAKPIVIGDHVWVGRRVDILKGVCLPNNMIVGMGSVVTKSFEQSYISIAGNPAQIIKKNINWTRKHIDSF